MARTVNFDFAQGGLASAGKVTMVGSQMTLDGPTIVLPTLRVEYLASGLASMTGVDPTPGDGSWRYQVKLEPSTGGAYYWIVDVPDLSTPVDFSTLPVTEAIAMPIDRTGTQLETWMVSVRAQATAANSNANAAMSSASDAHDRIDNLVLDGGTSVPTGGLTGQYLSKASNSNYDLEWSNIPGIEGGAILRHENISDPGPGTPLRSVNMDYPPDPNDAPDFFRYTIQNEITMWQNEWGAIRGTPSSALKTDALVRGVCRDDLGPTAAGGFIELTQRWWSLEDPRRQTFQVRWRDGTIMRNNIEMSLCYVRYGAAPLPAYLPPGTVVVTVND